MIADWVILNSRNFFSWIKKFKIKVLADLMSGEGPLLIGDTFHVALVAGEGWLVP